MSDRDSNQEEQVEKAPHKQETNEGANGTGFPDHSDITGDERPTPDSSEKPLEAADKDMGRQTQAGKSTDKAGDVPDVTGPERKGVEAKGDKEWEEFQRSRWVSPPDGVGFRLDEKNSAPGEMDRFLKDLPDDKRKALEDPKTNVTIFPSASRPGTEAYNQRLTEERGVALKRELEERGFRAQIKLVPLGERAAREDDRSPMSVKEPSDQDPQDRVDDPWDRTARIEIRGNIPETGVDPKRFDGEEIKDVVNKGNQVVKEKLEPLGEKVREQVPLEGNPAAPDPSNKPEEFAQQASEFIFDAISSPVQKGAEIAVGALLEAIGARDAMREETREKRKPLYRAVAEGVAAGYDASYANKSSWKPENAEQKALYEAGKRTVEGLNDAEKLQLGAFLTNYATQWETSVNYLAPRMDGYSVRTGLVRYFSSEKHFEHK